MQQRVIQEEKGGKGEWLLEAVNLMLKMCNKRKYQQVSLNT